MSGAERGAVTPADDVNLRYFVDYVKRQVGDRDVRTLDFGCGPGRLVGALRAEGIDCYGADIFYDGGDHEHVFATDLYREGLIRPIGEDGNVPFEDGWFDLIVSNQVFEHVERIDPVVAELDRLLAPGGRMYHHFPSREVVREGHIGIPLAHRLPRGRARFAYTWLARRAGLGHHKPGRSITEWTREYLGWIDTYCFYRPYREIERAFGGRFQISHREIDYCRFRAGGELRSLLGRRALRAPAEWLFRRLGFMAIELERRAP